MNRLSFIPLPFPEESPTSLLRRFALRHGFELAADLSNFTHINNIEKSIISCEGPLALWIAERAVSFREQFLEAFYRPVGRFTGHMPFKVLGTLTPNTMIRFGGIAFCSACRAEGYDRFVKDLRPALFCPYHHRRYLFQCPNCSKKLRWFDPMFDKCTCGHILECSECSAQDCAPEQKLRTLILEKQDSTLEALRRTLTILRYNTSPTPDNFQNREIFKAALAIAMGDSDGIHNYLLSLQAQYPEMPSAAIGAKLAEVKTPEVCKILQEYSDWKLPVPVDSADELVVSSNFFLHKSQIRAVTGIHYNIMQNIAAEHCPAWIDFPTPKMVPPKIFLVLLQKCREWKATSSNNSTPLDQLLTIEEASRLIMAEPNFIRRLIENGYLGPLRTPYQRLEINKNEVSLFLQSFESINSIAIRLGLPRQKVKRELDKYNLKPVLLPRSIKPTIYRRQDVDDLIILRQNSNKNYASRDFESKNILPEELSSYCTFEEAAKILKISRLIITDYAHAGLFQTYNHPDATLYPNVHHPSKSAYRMAKKDVDSFHHKYVLPVELGKLIEVSPSIATRTLIRFGHIPVLHDSDSIYSCEHRTPLFLRSDIDALLIKRDLKLADSMTIKHASNVLNLSKKTVIFFISDGTLALDSDSNNVPWASRSKVDIFFESYANLAQAAKLCNMPILGVQRFLAKFEVRPLCGPRINGCPDYIYRIDDILHSAGKVPTLRHSPSNSSNQPLEDLQPVTIILSRFNISKKSLTVTFINTGLVKTILIGKKLLLTNKDFNLISDILKKNLTLPMADRVLNSKGYSYALARDGSLSHPTDLPPELNKHSFVTLKSLNKFLRTRPTRPN
ncbi:hypothetical protein [Pseudomonas putida]|uniref:hypothetical protein n=1 Tax=Pseudomonas putida TaxID=303 RepID=UPI0015DD15C2|nr:hypothetical protein [Pseudomonas putida]BBR52747.1 hypothetical protein WP4W18C03_10740 [Pseudomonas putida]